MYVLPFPLAGEASGNFETLLSGARFALAFFTILDCI